MILDGKRVDESLDGKEGRRISNSSLEENPVRLKTCAKIVQMNCV